MPTRSPALDSLAFERYIAQHSRSLGLDPAAVLAVASTEGGFRGPSSSPGDHGTSFGPFQLHIGGALPANVKDPQTWAWSKEGIDYALGRIQSVAGNKGGEAAVTSIVYQFERPADPARETATALSRYNDFAQFNIGSEQSVGGGELLPGSGNIGQSGSSPQALARGLAKPLGIDALINAFGAVGGAIRWITDPHNITRIAEVIMGAVLLLLGLGMMGKAGITPAARFG